jgi:hypothetical protein
VTMTIEDFRTTFWTIVENSSRWALPVGRCTVLCITLHLTKFRHEWTYNLGCLCCKIAKKFSTIYLLYLIELKSFNSHLKKSVWSMWIGRIVPIYILYLTLGSGLERFCQFRTCVKSSVVWGPGPVVRRCSPQSLTDPAPRRPPSIAFVHITSSGYQKWPFYIPEHYRCSLMRVRRDVDLQRPATRRRRRVEFCLYNIRHNTEHKYINLGCLRTRHETNITRSPWVAAPSLPIPDTTYPPKKTVTVPWQKL